MSESDFGHSEDSVTVIIDIYMAKLIVVNTSSQKKKKKSCWFDVWTVSSHTLN